jgi:hypothetical protein
LFGAFNEQYKLQDMFVGSKPFDRDKATRIGMIAISPVLALGTATAYTIAGVGSVLSGKAFKKNDNDVYIATEYFYGGETVKYAIAKVSVTERKEKLLYRVETPTREDDWVSNSRSYIAIIAVKESSEDNARKAL